VSLVHLKGAFAMRSDYAVGRGPILRKTPNSRQQAGRRRLAMVAGMAALALGSALVGALNHTPPSVRTATGPFSYFPSE
jgi:ferric-dicitrate binding protein FerR (iron transport regulator)